MHVIYVVTSSNLLQITGHDKEATLLLYLIDCMCVCVCVCVSCVMMRRRKFVDVRRRPFLPSFFVFFIFRKILCATI